MLNRYYQPLTAVIFGLLSIVIVVSAVRLIGVEVGVSDTTVNKYSNVSDVIHEQRMKFVAEHGVVDPAALVAAVSHSSMADLLISVAIEESGGDPVAVGSAGEQGAWQVKASDWGFVPKDIHGQAWQAERIIRALLLQAKGNSKRALAEYNGGTVPPGKSYRYAERVLKRANYLQAVVNSIQPGLSVVRNI